MRPRAVLVVLALGLWLCRQAGAAQGGEPTAAQEERVAVPAAPQGRISDYARILNEEARGALEAQLLRYEKETPNEGGAPQIAVVTVPSLGGEPVETVALRFAERWKIGSKQDDGVILLLATSERKLRIEVGYGAEGRLPDAIAARIIREIIAPRLKAEDFAGGLQRGAAAIHQALLGQPVTGEDPQAGLAPVPVRPRPDTSWGIGGGVGMLLLLLLMLRLNRRGGGGFLTGMLLGTLFGGRGRGLGGGGGGGFSGGGGGFGGGGASGDY